MSESRKRRRRVCSWDSPIYEGFMRKEVSARVSGLRNQVGASHTCKDYPGVCAAGVSLRNSSDHARECVNWQCRCLGCHGCVQEIQELYGSKISDSCLLQGSRVAEERCLALPCCLTFGSSATRSGSQPKLFTDDFSSSGEVGCTRGFWVRFHRRTCNKRTCDGRLLR